MNLHTARGTVENLRIVEAQQNIVFGPHMREASGISALVFAAAGMGGAAVSTSMNADAAEDVNLYSFELNGVKYAGCTRKATLQNGDQVELVFEPKTKGNEVLAVRRPATRSIWLYPFMSRGTVAAKRHGLATWLKFSFWLSLLLAGLFFVTFLISRHRFNLTLYSYLVTGSFLGTPLVLALATSWMLPRFYRFAQAADEVFAAFGYEEPTKVDLGKTTKAYRKKHGTPLTWDNKAELWY